MLLGLRTIIYPAPDLAKAKQWYSDVLGMQPYFDEPFYVGFSVGGFELGLIPDATPGITGSQAMILPRTQGHLAKRLVWLQMLLGLNIPVLSEAVYDCNTHR